MEQIILWLVVVPIGYAVWYFIKREKMARTCKVCLNHGRGVVKVYPIDGTQDRYKCPECGHEFAAAPHDM
jgi:ribosomal protein S27AE